ncbi:hypothetical protein Q8A67_025002 [Cirrhinus molitorella]|uniref:von Willebrand factor A domain-containing protein 5A-like n=1 Tax=Cirrhinus molitorella TaxID=172907 RepID=A0AA88NVE4_9TELE|nr:hypothetical protein Q8A67_025002 [Cirrhinus molitorella]
MENWGLVSYKNEPVPLKSISVEVRVQDHVATVSSTLQYVNEEERPLEALFVFPLPADAAVCHCSAKIGEQEIVAEVQDRESARDQYDDAVSSGQQAFLLEESAESPDVFKLSVGCLSAGQNAAVTIIYVTELTVQEDHSLRFCLPAVLNPRYTPAGSGAGIVSEISSGAVPYTLTLSVHVSSPKPISKLESNCTLDPLVFLHSDHTQATVNLSPGHMFDKDVELFVYYQDTHQPSAIVEAGVTTAPPGSLMRDPVVMISLYPEFPEEVMKSLGTQGEFVFVIDRSGSMGSMMQHETGAQMRIESAKDTLLLLLKSLPMGCYFNIYGFGSRFESFFTQSVEYKQKTMDQAQKRVKKMQADMGGTEILQPLKHIYSQRCLPDHPRQLFVFTDGEVGNTKEVLDLVKSHAHSHRCFSFGIGEGASAALITGMAREGSGHAQFITDTDRMQPKVMQSLRFALQPAVVNISVDWTLPDGLTVDTLSPPINVLFQGQRTLIYAQLKGESSGGSEGSVTVKYSLKDQPVTNQLHFCLKPTEETGLSIHRLAARTLIRSLEQKKRSGAADVEGIKSRMVELGVQAGVSSVHTAFIAVNKDTRQTVKGPLVKRRVPTYTNRQNFRDSAFAFYSRHSLWLPNPIFFHGIGLILNCCGGMIFSCGLKTLKDPFLQLVSLQKASGCWELDVALADVFGKRKDELTNQKPAQVDGSVWATVLALIWLYGCKIEQQVEWQFVAMKAVSWISSQKVPLKSISVEVRVQDHVATVSSTLQYVNEEERPLEALFVFPLPADAAVCHFSAKIGEQEIARDQYDDAVSSGRQAFLLEESAESPDVFKLSVGCLSAGQNAAVTIIYVTELTVQEDHSLRFCLPAVLNPRYTPAVSEISSGAVPYTLTLSVHVSSPKPISKLESNCTLDPLVFLHSDHTQATVNLSPGHMFDKDLELFVYYQDTHQPSAIVEAGVTTAPPGSLMRDPVVMISLYPEFPEEVMKSLATRGEFVFVIDRSGSMGSMMQHETGAQMRIESAKDTLLLLLKSLPMGCYFNIYGFGSDFESIFPLDVPLFALAVSVEYKQKTMDQAQKRVKKMQADMGGTEILQPLKHIYSQRCLPDHPRQLFIFTDGEVGNTKEVLDLVKSHAHSHRCFSFGIGEGASAALITGMAREGSGHAQFITDTDRMQPKVMQSLRFALQPAVVNISVDWTLPDGLTVDTLSPPINVLFQGQRTLIYAQLKGESSGGSEGSVTVKYSLKDQPVTNQLHFCLKPTEETGSGAADVEGIKSRMVELGVQAGVSSVHTAFIAVNKDTRQTVKGPLQQRRCCFNAPFVSPQKDPFLQLVSLQKASGCWELDVALADVFGKRKDELTNQKPAQLDGSVWATVLALIWLYGCKIEQQVEWQFVAMKAVSWISSEKGGISITDHIHSSISVEVRVQDHVATVSSTLQYVNEEERPLEALFVFPLPADAAVCHFSAKIGEQEIVAELQDRESARDQYDDAVSSGQQAFLLEESAESPDVFKLSVGCLSAGQNAAVTIIYVTELTVQEDHSLRFCLPAVLNPRYTPAASGAGIVSEISSGAVPYTLTLSVHVSSPKPISKLESNCTLDPLVFLHSDHTQATVNLSPGHMFDKDLELFVYYQDTHQPSAIVEAGVTTAPPGSLMRDPVVMISLYPVFPEEVMKSLATRGEFVFVIDRSGSMECSMHHETGAQMRIESAKDTLLLLLKSLPMGCYFNIYGFGSDFEAFFPQSVEYNQDTVDQALKRVKKMQADMGGTEILQPLKHIYSQRHLPDHPRQLFIFTDGEVFNTKAVLDLVKSHAHSHRCFSFGIGEGASAALITGMAREGSGHAQFITDTDRMQPKVMQSLRFALQPSVFNISVDWTLPDGLTVDTLSPPINVLFQGQRTLIYAQLKGESSGGSEGSVTIKHTLKDQPVTNQLHFCLKPTEETGLSIHRLAARTLIRSLEQEERSGAADVEGIRSRMVELSVQAGVSSVHTAFIAVNKDSRQTVKGPLVKRRVPTRDLSSVIALMQANCGQVRTCRSQYSALYADEQLFRCSKMMSPRAITERAFLKMSNLVPEVTAPKQKIGFMTKIQNFFHRGSATAAAPSDQTDSESKNDAAPDSKMDPLLQLVSLQKASGCWELDVALAEVFGNTEDELTNQKPAQLDGSVWATVLALIWLYGCKIEQQVEWQFVAMKAVSWISSQKVGDLSQCVCVGNVLLGCQVTKETLGI